MGLWTTENVFLTMYSVAYVIEAFFEGKRLENVVPPLLFCWFFFFLNLKGVSDHCDDSKGSGT